MSRSILFSGTPCQRLTTRVPSASQRFTSEVYDETTYEPARTLVSTPRKDQRRSAATPAARSRSMSGAELVIQTQRFGDGCSDSQR